MPKGAVHSDIDQLLQAMMGRGLNAKRSDAIEILAQINGCRNSHEMMAHPTRRRTESPEPSLKDLVKPLDRLSKFKTVKATRDGHSFEAVICAEEEDEFEVAVRAAARGFDISDIIDEPNAYSGMDLDERLAFAEGEMDTFDVEPIAITLDPRKFSNSLRQKAEIAFIREAIVSLEMSIKINEGT